MTDNNHVCFTQTLDGPTQTLTVEYVRDADWDRHWAVYFNGASGCRQEISRFGSYHDARRRVQRHLQSRSDRNRKMRRVS